MGRRLGPPTILCRTCANWLGRPLGAERRRSAARTCGAGLAPRGDVFSCESYVKIPLAAIFDGRRTARRKQTSSA